MTSRLTKPSSWVLEPEASTFAPTSKWSNKDMDPVPVYHRTWTTSSYVAYWLSGQYTHNCYLHTSYFIYPSKDACNVAVYELASSMLATGLSWHDPLSKTLRLPCSSVPPRRQALPAIAIGHCIIAVVMVLNGTIGARLHVAFPVLNRSSFGFWLSYFSVISRVVLSLFWFGIQVGPPSTQYNESNANPTRATPAPRLFIKC